MPLTRRQFLIASSVTGAGALAAGGGVVAASDLFDAAKKNPLPTGSGVLVLVTLYGGNDGLNTVVPATDPAYQKARPDLAYGASEVLALRDGVGLNPAMKGLHALWGQNQLGIVEGVGYPQPDRSHFRSMAIWQTASPKTSSPSGWLGRWLDATGTDPLRAIAVGPTLPPLLAGEKVAGAAVPTGRFRAPAGALGRDLRALSRPQVGEAPLAARVASSGSDLFTVADTLTPALGQAKERDAGTPGQLEGGGNSADGGGELAAQLDLVASCIGARAPTRAYSVSLGGFDTHADEKGTQQRLLGELDTALAGFQRTISAQPGAKNVVTVVYSEFGRRVAANGSDGTDHGTAAPVFVLGTNVRGGFHGERPSLTDLDDGDLKMTTDFRAVYATVLEQVLGTDAGRVLGSGESFDRLDLVHAA